MGAHPYWYFYETTTGPELALQLLRKREFNAGRYYPALDLIEFPLNDKSPCPGPKHASIDEMTENMDETGTRSILEIAQISDNEDEMCSARIVDDDELVEWFDSTKPTKEAIEASLELFDDLDRGTCRFCKYFDKNGAMVGYFFVGYSFD